LGPFREGARGYDGPVVSDTRGVARAPWATPRIRLVLRLAMLVGLALGVETVVLHLVTDPLADVHAYYDAGARLNAGEPLYDQPATTDEAAFYRYPPLLAILFRPLALLPFGVAAAIWMAAIAAMVVVTLWRIDLRRPLTQFVVCALALPMGWAIVIGQAQVAVTMLLAIGMPWSVAFAANLKLFPILVALHWVGRRDWRCLRNLAIWLAALAVIQLVLEPAGTLAYPGFLRIDQVGSVVSLSPYAVSPWLWAALFVAGVVAALRVAPRRYGWAVAVGVATLASPRLLLYQLSSLVAAVRDPGDL
jgi:Glycosyltransferase family 87